MRRTHLMVTLVGSARTVHRQGEMKTDIDSQNACLPKPDTLVALDPVSRAQYSKPSPLNSLTPSSEPSILSMVLIFYFHFGLFIGIPKIEQQQRPLEETTMKKLAPWLFGLALVSTPALATYPDKPIRMVVPFAAGTTTDTVARAIGESLSKELGQPIIIENKAGAGGAIGTDYVAKSKPDGYTLEFGTVGTFAINKGLFAKLPYDPSKDFTYLLMPGYTPTLLVVGRQAPYNTLADLINDARKRPGAVSFASAGNGTSGHLAGELLKNVASVDMIHVPYKSGAQALTDTIGGQVGFLFYHPVAVVPHLKEGNLKALGASSKARASLAPNIPSIAESGYQGFDLTAWFMLAAPAGLPKDVENRLRTAAAKIINEPSVKDILTKQGIEGTPITGAALNTFVESEITKWADIIVKAKARID